MAFPSLPPISARRAYLEVLGVFAAFFGTGIILAALVLANRSQDVVSNGSWAIYLTEVVQVSGEIGLALTAVVLLCWRRGVKMADLGLSVPRRTDGKLAVSQSIRVAAWAFTAELVGGILNAVLQSGHLPNQTSNAPEAIFSVFDALQAGIIEELVVLAFVVITLRQAGRPLWEITLVALALRGSYHIYYGPGVFGILLWASLYYWLYLRTRALPVLMACHFLWDLVAFMSQLAKAVADVAFLAMVVLVITAFVLWLVERSDRGAANPLYAGPGGPYPGPVGPYPGPAGPYPAGSYPAGSYPAGSYPVLSYPPGPYAAGSQPAVPSVPPAPPAPAAPLYGATQGAGPPPNGQGQDGHRPNGSPRVAPGWHPDPDGTNRWRWWDGQRWSDHVSRHD